MTDICDLKRIHQLMKLLSYEAMKTEVVATEE